MDLFPYIAVLPAASGSLLFYVSDIVLAVARFRNPFRYNRISLLFYYSGQPFIALSAAFVYTGAGGGK